jgi:hypothetical protein
LSATITLNKNSIVKFDEVSVNEGNHFNSGDGIFVAPVYGTYGNNQNGCFAMFTSHDLIKEILQSEYIHI